MGRWASPAVAAAEFKVDRKIPLPGRGHSEWSRKYPFDKMKVGDSFAVSTDQGKLVSDASYAYGKKHGIKFVRRKDKVNEQFRIWRVS